MDSLSQAYVARAQSALNMLAGEDSRTPVERGAAAFIEIAKTVAQYQRQPETALVVLKASHSELVQKAMAEVLDVNDVFAGPAAQVLAQHYVASVAQFSLLDQLLRYATVIPGNMRQVMFGSGSVGNTVVEGGPKVTLNLSLNLGDTIPIKSVALVVMSNELARFAGEAGRRMFAQELERAVVRAANAAVMAAFVDSGSSVVAAGANPLESMRAGLQAATGSQGYVVAMNESDAAYLATVVENKGGMGPRGGEFAPGINVVAVDGMSGMLVFPASRFAMWDGGLRITSSGEASVDMRASPADPYEQTSLYQTNSTAVLAERLWQVVGSTDGVVSVEAS